MWRTGVPGGQVSLTEPNTVCLIEGPASHRSDGVRVHPGMPFGFPPESVFSFAVIPELTLRVIVKPEKERLL
jgi:hypothetical protein